MDSNWVLILLVGVAIISYNVGSSQCDSTRVVYKWLPRNLDEDTDPAHTRDCIGLVALLALQASV